MGRCAGDLLRPETAAGGLILSCEQGVEAFGFGLASTSSVGCRGLQLLPVPVGLRLLEEGLVPIGASGRRADVKGPAGGLGEPALATLFSRPHCNSAR